MLKMHAYLGVVFPYSFRLFSTLLLVLFGLSLLAQHQVAAELTEYEIGTIPEQSAYPGHTRAFEVHSAETGEQTVYSIEATPWPVGPIHIDEASGLFEYAPDAQDRRPFEIRFKAEGLGGHIAQTVIMSPQCTPVPEASILERVMSEPDPSEYTTWLEEPVLGDAVEMNDCVWESGDTRNVTISGVTVILDRSMEESPARVYGDPSTLAANANIRELVVSADTVVIRDRLHFPQTNVTINARELRFEDKDGEQPACIVTTPLPRIGRATDAAWLRNPYDPPEGQESPYFTKSADIRPAADGKHGHHGGHVTLHVSEFYAPENDGTPVVRFDLSGGKGQDAGNGAHGIDAPDINNLPFFVNGVRDDDVSFKYKEELDLGGNVWAYPYSGIYCDLNNGQPAPYRRARYGAMSSYHEVRVNTWEEGFPPIIVTKSSHTYISRCFEWEKGFPSPDPVPEWPAYLTQKPLWWLDGLDAIRPGQPGNGGDSGLLTASLPLVSCARLHGGLCGAPGDEGVNESGFFEGGKHGLRNYVVQGIRDASDGNYVARFFIWSHYNKYWGGSWWGNTYFDDSMTCPAPNHDFPMSVHTDPYLSTEQIHCSQNGSRTWPRTGLNGDDNADGDRFTLLEDLDDARMWLTAEGVRSTLRYLRDLYLTGHVERVRQVTEYYIAALELLIGDEHDDLLQLREEMQVLHHRAANNLDYFGNPSGWAPMLSFEANLAAFENEIDRAIRVLYMTYWLDKKAESAQHRAAALEYAQDQLVDELERFIGMYKEAQAAMPGLEVQAVNIDNQIKEKRDELKQIEQRLLREAEANVTPPKWKQDMKIASAVLNMVPVAQPLFGTIGKGLDIITQMDSQSSWDTAGAFGELAATTAASELRSTAEGLGKTLDIVKAEIEANKDKKPKASPGANLAIQPAEQGEPKIAVTTALMIGTLAVGETAKGAEQIANGIGPLVDAIKGTQVPESVITAELQRLRASSPAFLTVSEDILELMREKGAFAQKLASTLQKLTTASTGITQTGLALIATSENLSSSVEKLDQRAFMYIKEMEQRARDRLLKYQYYVAKAFEYRMLRPYAAELNLDRLYDAFKNLGELADNAGISGVDAHDDHDLSWEEFELLKGIYVEELSRITAEIFDELNTNAPERSVAVAFALGENELDELNTTGQLRINLKEKNLFGRTEENLRIHDLRTESISAHAPGGAEYGGTALLRLKYEHSGCSLLSSRGRIFTFNHYQTTTANPISWKTVYDGVRNVKTETQISAASQSLLQYLLESGQRSADNLLLYSRPAAWADFLITKEAVTGTGVNMIIDDLRIEVEYDYFEKRDDLLDLDVVVAGDLMPIILL
jgi:hypothetical protein